MPKLSSAEPLRVLVVDDSAYVRFSVARHLEGVPDLVVAGCAGNGREALAMIPDLNPDVVTLDVEMPVLDGLTTLHEIMNHFPRPVVMMSSRTTAGAAVTIKALTLGAVDFIAKPESRASINVVMEELVEKIRACRAVRLHSRAPIFLKTRPLVESEQALQLEHIRRTDKIVVIGASTGGPRALSEVVPALPADLKAGVLIVQHMPVGFTGPLAQRLNRISSLEVREARDGDVLCRGQALLAPGGFHMQIGEGGAIRLNEKPSVHGVRPAVDVTMASVVPACGNRSVGVVLTGMGRDGSNGASLIHAAGGWVIAEDQSTCIVWGMPRSVTEHGASDEVVPLHQISAAIERAVQRMP
ncbi:MAG: chemotaxis response regulator protein-glutamate methylesterase [Anaerolineales bacterium]|nr:chemotaxis response regulator protein-glutamate methylesterase [Anaerolineales bacterium]